MKAQSRRVLLSAAVLVFLLFAAQAFASAPSNSPSVIRSIGFESSSDSTTMTPSSGLGTTAFWGRTTNDKHAGTSSAWCAATAYPSLLPSGAWPTYLTGTSGDLRVTLPDLADYYSSSLTFWYKMPSIGFADTWIVAFGSSLYSNFLPTSNWTQQSYNLASRQGTSLVMRFVDKEELPDETPTLGMGPLVDDISVQGFKYGAVRNITAADAPDAAPLPVVIDRSATEPGCILLAGNRSAIALSWSRPYASQTSLLADTRPLTYRVWRKTASQDWVELTEGTSGVANEQFMDAPPPGDYTYAVQAGDAAGSGHGLYSEGAVSVSGALNNSTVASISYSLDGGATQTVAASSVLLSALGDGRTHELTFFVTSTGGVSSRSETLAIALARDAVAPVTTALVSNASWTNSSAVTVTLDAADTGGSSLGSTWYRIGNGTASKYLGPFPVSSEGETSVYFNSMDNASPPNIEATKSVSVRIDRTAPVAQALVDGNRSQSAGVSIAATDTLSGINRIEYEVTGPDALSTQTSWGRTVATKKFTAVGAYTLTYRAFDAAGNSTSGAVSFEVKPYDVSAPVTTAGLSTAEWTNADAVTVTLEAHDVGAAGLASTWYCIGTGSFQRYTGAFSVSSVGSTTVDFYSVDDAYPQNTEATKSVVVRIDRSSPTATATVIGGGTSKASVLISADDLISGVGSIEYSVAGPSSVATKTIAGGQALTGNFTQSGDYVLSYRAIDAAGNSCDGSVAFKVKADSLPAGGGGGGGGGATPSDTTPPQSLLLLSHVGWTSEDVTLTLSATDNDGGSGVAGIVYRLGSSAEATYVGSPIVVSGEGQTPVVYHAVDLAGNSEPDKAAIVRIDKTSPAAPGAVSYVSLTGSSVSLVWPAAVDSGSGVASYEVSDGDAVLATVSGTSAVLSGLAPGSSHIFSVVAVDAAGNRSMKGVFALSMPVVSSAVDIPAGSSVTATMSVPSLSTSSSLQASVTIESVTRAGEMTIVRSEKPPADAPSTFKFLGEYYDVSFTGQAAGVITVTLPYDARIPSGRALGLKLQHYTTTGWENLPTSIDLIHHTLTAQLTSLSPVDIVEPASVSTEATIAVAKSFVAEYHKSAVITARLKSASGESLPGFVLTAQIQKSGAWSTVSTFTATATSGSYVATIPAADGVKVVRVALARNPLYSAKPATTYVRPKVKFSTVKSVTTARAGVSFRVSGSMAPAHSGQVRVTAYKVYGTSLKAVKTVKVTSKSTGSFSAAFALPRGTYRFKASHGTTSVSTEHALTTSSASAKVVVR